MSRRSIDIPINISHAFGKETIDTANIAANGSVVFTERPGSQTMGGIKVDEPFVGVFEVSDTGRSRADGIAELRSWE